MFYANEHDPVHVHARKGGKESKAEITVKEGKDYSVKITRVRGKESLERSDLKDFEEFVKVYAERIVQKWIDFFVLGKRVRSEKITKKVKS